MEEFKSIFVSDSLSRDWTKFTPGALVSALEQAWKNGLPSFLSHDATRPIGWNLARYVHFEPGLTRLGGSLFIADRDDDWPDLKARLQAFYEEQQERHAGEVKQLRAMLPVSEQEASVSIFTECVALRRSGIAAELFPSLFPTDNSLARLSALKPLGPGVFQIGELALFAHAYFRRSLAIVNSLNTPFLEYLSSLDPSRLDVQLALDPDLVGLARSYVPRVEQQYWWGPHFSEDLATIVPGVSYYEAEEVERLMHGVSGTEFWWQSRKGEHIFEVEELRNTPTQHSLDNQYGCRYAHSIVKEGSGKIIHFDGAIRFYSQEEMIERLAKKLPETRRDKPYKKLWRVDGELMVSEWKRLLSDYFRDNHLVGEYLGAESTDRSAPVPQSRDSADLPSSTQRISSFVHVIRRGAGPRISLSFRPLPNTSSPISIIPQKVVVRSGKTLPVVEAETLELVKLGRRRGLEFRMEKDVQLIAYEDLYYNLALLWHSSKDSAMIENSTSVAIHLISLWESRGLDFGVSLSIGYPIGEVGAVISILGHGNDVLDWLRTNSIPVFKNLVAARSWADSVSRKLSSFPTADDTPPLFEAISPLGILEIPRFVLDPTHYDVELSTSEEGLVVHFKVDPTIEPDLYSELLNKRVGPSICFLIERSQCARCRQSYRKCKCSKLADAGCYQIIQKAQPIFSFLTDRHS